MYLRKEFLWLSCFKSKDPLTKKKNISKEGSIERGMKTERAVWVLQKPKVSDRAF